MIQGSLASLLGLQFESAIVHIYISSLALAIIETIEQKTIAENLPAMHTYFCFCCPSLPASFSFVLTLYAGRVLSPIFHRKIQGNHGRLLWHMAGNSCEEVITWSFHPCRIELFRIWAFRSIFFPAYCSSVCNLLAAAHGYSQGLALKIKLWRKMPCITCWSA